MRHGGARADAQARRAGDARWPGLLLAALLLTAAPAPAQQGDTVTVEQRVFMAPDLTPAQARRRAIDGALAEAARRVGGVRVQSHTLNVLDERGSAIRDGYSSVVQLDAAARAVGYVVVDDGWETVRHPRLGDQLYYRTTVRVAVERETGEPDAGFVVDVTLDAPTVVVRGPRAPANDEIVATVTSTHPAHLYVFAIADDSAERVFPNDYVRQLPIAAGVPVEVPPAEWRERGVRLRASLPPGVTERRELLMVVATRRPVPPPAAGRLTVMALQQWLVRIPAGDRAMGVAPYEVRREGGR